MQRKLLLLILCCICSETIFSQTLDLQAYENNQAKYWLYRERLKNEFMIGIGPNQGQSLPASERIKGAGASNNAGINGALLKWGDGTIMLGQYIGVLAIELRLLIEFGSDYIINRNAKEKTNNLLV